jgi:16S rRNA (cytosine1402-N4)-methyltransferase
VSSTVHVPVMPDEVIHWLAPQPGKVLVDGTFGGGGHTRLLAERVAPHGLVIAIDRDPRAAVIANRLAASWPIQFHCASYADLPQVLESLSTPLVDGVVLDLGLSSDQLADHERGFSYDADGPLDLRFDPTEGDPAWQLLQRLSERDIADVIYKFGEERFSRRVARRIVERRKQDPIRTAQQLAELVRSCVPRSKHHAIDPATRTFQALRIAVNDELGELERALAIIPDCLRDGGRIAVISFHSLEDRLVKHALRGDPRMLVLTKKPIRPIEAELFRNPRSRSARLRVGERIARSN